MHNYKSWGTRMRAFSRAAVVAASVGVVAVGGVIVAQANEPTAADEQQSLVEDFAYPDAARILTEDNVKLISGDGHILYTPCATQPLNGVGQMEVHSNDLSVGKEDGKLCFKVTGSTGYISMLIPDVFEIRGDGFGSGQGHGGTADVTSGTGQRRTVPLKPNGSQQVGVGSNGAAESLVRLEIKP